jgi:hypothetical protein
MWTGAVVLGCSLFWGGIRSAHGLVAPQVPALPPTRESEKTSFAVSVGSSFTGGNGGSGSGSESFGAGAGHLVVLVHGLAGKADDLAYLAEALRAHGSTVLTVTANEGRTTDGVGWVGIG